MGGGSADQPFGGAEQCVQSGGERGRAELLPDADGDGDAGERVGCGIHEHRGRLAEADVVRDYVPMGNWIFHNKHGFLYPAPGSTPQNIWFYTQDMGWLYTSSTLYPYLYRSSPASWLWYNGATNPRWFNNMTAGQWESRP